MNDRGEYRTIYCAFADDPDVHELSGNAVKLLMLLKLSLPATGIGVVYNTAQAERMRMTLEQLDHVYRELEAVKPGSENGWIRRDRNVVWVVNALKFEPGLSPANVKKHIPFVRRLVAELDPKLAIVRAFKRHYREWFGDDPDSQSEGYPKGNDTLSGDRVSHRVSIQKTRIAKKSKRKDSGDLGTERGRRGRAKDLVAQLPAGAREFGKHFYRAAPRDRQIDVMEQLLATLNGGAEFSRGVKVAAGSPERLSAKCRQVIDEGVNDPDKAIVVLLRKLADVGNAQDSPTEKAARNDLDTERVDAAHMQHAFAWLEANPDRAAEIDAEVDREMPDTASPFRSVYRMGVVARAWRDAGSPMPHTAGSS